MIKILTNAANTKRLIVNSKNILFKDALCLSAHTQSELPDIIGKHKLVELPITHRTYRLKIRTGAKELVCTVTLFELERQLPGAWFRGEVSRDSGDRRAFPCYFTLIPVRKKLGVYAYKPVLNIIHANNSELSMYPQEYDSYEAVPESVLRIADYTALGVVGNQSQKNAA